MSDLTEREYRDVERISSLAGEHFGDYVLLVRLNSGGLAWRSSNPDWARGAMGRYDRRLLELETKADVE